MGKRPTVSKLKRKADALFSQYIRMRDCDKYGYVTCITCGARKPWKEMQNGHFIKRSVNSLRFDEENCNAQCYSCNVMKYGEQYKYAQELDLKYGDGTAKRLHDRRYETHKFTVQELEGIIADAKTQIAWYENNH